MMKPLPHGVCQKLSKSVPTRSSRRVEQLCFLVRRNSTVRLPGALERRYSLSKRKITRWLLHLHSSFHVFFSFVLFLPFFFSFFFSFIFSPFPHFSLNFSPPFWSIDRMGQKEEVFSPPSSSQLRGFPFSFFFFYFIILFVTSYPTWLNMSHGIMPPMWLNVSHSFFMPIVTLLRCHVASPNLAMYHPTSHASKNLKSGPPRNPMKFDVVTKFREKISMEKSISSSEI